MAFKDNFDIFSKDIKLTLSGLTHEFRASDFVFSDSFGLESLESRCKVKFTGME